MSPETQSPRVPLRADDLAACQTEARQGDPDRFLCSLFASPDGRAGLWALYALNLELAQIRAAVTDPLPGQIRLQWWREAMAEAFSAATTASVTPRAHPVVRLVAATLPGRVPEAELQALIDARAADILDGGPETLVDLEKYLVATTARVQRLAAQVLAGEDAPTLQAATATGLALGTVGMIRALAYQAHSHQRLLPTATLRAAGVREGDVIQHKMTAAIGGLVEQLATTATGHLSAARAARGEVRREALPALLPCVLVEGFLQRLRQRGWDPFRHGLERPGAGTLLRLGWAGWRRRY